MIKVKPVSKAVVMRHCGIRGSGFLGRRKPFRVTCRLCGEVCRMQGRQDAFDWAHQHLAFGHKDQI